MIFVVTVDVVLHRLCGSGCVGLLICFLGSFGGRPFAASYFVGGSFAVPSLFELKGADRYGQLPLQQIYGGLPRGVGPEDQDVIFCLWPTAKLSAEGLESTF
jgi:hypothetical protein